VQTILAQYWLSWPMLQHCPNIGAMSLKLANLRQYTQYWNNVAPILLASRVVHYLIGAVFGILSREISVLYVSELI